MTEQTLSNQRIPLSDSSTFDNSLPWSFYNELIQGIPEGIKVTGYGIGVDWGYVNAECGMGISHTVRGGSKGIFKDDPRSYELKELAELVKSWNFVEASMGLAAINAWYSQKDKVEAMGALVDDGDASYSTKGNAFYSLQDEYEGKNVAVIGHFPNVVGMAKHAKITVLERNCNSPMDTPDPACEYILPVQDFVFMTGTTIINKTAPRLFELSKNAKTTIIGPSAVPCDAVFERGVNVIAGSVVVDPEAAALAVLGGSKQMFRTGIKKYSLER